MSEVNKKNNEPYYKFNKQSRWQIQTFLEMALNCTEMVPSCHLLDTILLCLRSFQNVTRRHVTTNILAGLA